MLEYPAPTISIARAFRAEVDVDPFDYAQDKPYEMSASLIIIFGIMIAALCLAGARMKVDGASFNRTVFYTILALLVALLLWLAIMVLFVGPAMHR